MRSPALKARTSSDLLAVFGAGGLDVMHTTKSNTTETITCSSVCAAVRKQAIAIWLATHGIIDLKRPQFTGYGANGGPRSVGVVDIDSGVMSQWITFRFDG
jgi:hypothetical protein